MKVVNIVCEYKLLGEIPILNSKKTENFSGFTLKTSAGTCRYYENGYCIVTGVKEVATADDLIRNNFPNPIITRRIILITASGKIPFSFSFSKLLQWHSQNPDRSNFQYESEIFPAIYWCGAQETIHFFPSGSAILTGFKSVDRVYTVWAEFLRELYRVYKECIPESQIQNG